MEDLLRHYIQNSKLFCSLTQLLCFLTNDSCCHYSCLCGFVSHCRLVHGGIKIHVLSGYPYKGGFRGEMDEKPSSAVSVSAVPPYGHVIINAKWRGSALVQHFKGSVKTIYEEELGVVDLHLSNRSCVLYVSESDLVAANDYRRKIVRFKNSNSKLQGIVIAEKTRLSEQYYSALQGFVVLELGLTLLPVAGPAEAAQLIEQMVHGESKENPFQKKTISRLLDPVVLKMVQQIPGVGKVKAMALLERFPSIYDISNASLQELQSVVGQATAQQIWGFFHNPLN